MRLVLLALALSACPAQSPTSTVVPGSSGPTSTVPTVPHWGEVTVDEVAAIPVADRFLVDVRTPAEFAGGHALGAINIPLSEIGAHTADLDPHKGETIYAICAVGGRSARASAQLETMGFTVKNVTGGTTAWIAAGHPTE